MKVVAFTVHGVPAPQGSKNPWGGEANPRTRPWRAAVSAAAAEEMGEEGVLLGPVEVRVTFRFPRPKAHYRTGKNADLLRDTAPTFHTSYPDLDKLQRAIGDSLTGVVLRDDKQIARWVVAKEYGDQALAHVYVSPLEEGAST